MKTGKRVRTMKQLWIPTQLHQRVKVEASIRGISIEALAMRLLTYSLADLSRINLTTMFSKKPPLAGNHAGKETSL